MPSAQNLVKFTPRLSASRGYANHGWLNTYHSFSFANYYSPAHNSFGPLRVLNEDAIAPRNGFPNHPHAAFEIFTYVVKGELTHTDSMGNLEVMKRGDVQYTSAGRGIVHSEENKHPNKGAQILQIWALPLDQPDARTRKPKYFTRHHTDDVKTGVLRRIIAPAREVFKTLKEEDVKGQDGTDELIPVPADLNFYASILPVGQTVEHQFTTSPEGKEEKRKGYLHVVMSSGVRGRKDAAPVDGPKVKVTSDDGSEIVLEEGDAVKIEARTKQKISIESVGGKDAEFVFFDMGAKEGEDSW